MARRTSGHRLPRKELLRLVEVFSGDSDLLHWLKSLEMMTIDERCEHLNEQIVGLKRKNQHPFVIEAVEALMIPWVYASVLRTIQEMRGN
jgi:hypothetical protein